MPIILPISGQMTPPKSVSQAKGLGDLVERFIHKQILPRIPKAMADKLKNCGGCHSRKDFLNKAFPIKNEVNHGQ